MVIIVIRAPSVNSLTLMQSSRAQDDDRRNLQVGLKIRFQDRSKPQLEELCFLFLLERKKGLDQDSNPALKVLTAHA